MAGSKKAKAGRRRERMRSLSLVDGCGTTRRELRREFLAAGQRSFAHAHESTYAHAWIVGFQLVGHVTVAARSYVKKRKRRGKMDDPENDYSLLNKIF